MAMPDSEKDMFDSALTDQPMDAVDAPVEVEVTTDKPDGKQRDEKGRFVSAEKPEQVEAKPETVTETPERPQEQRQERGEIPSWRLKEESDAKREWQSKAEQAQRDAENSRQELAAMRQRMSGFERQIAEKNNPPPDMYADPEGYQRYQSTQYESRLRMQAVQFNEQLARVKFGDDLYSKAEQELERHVQMNPLDPIVHVIQNSQTPAFEMVNWFQQREAQKRLGGKSIDDLLKEEREKALNDPEFLAKAIEKSKAVATPVQNTANTNIPSLNRATAATQNIDDNDTSDAALFKASLAGR